MSAFEVYPAIDLRGGRVVRLWQGDPEQEFAFSEDPEAMARHWLEAGARWLHVVNLDAALGEDDRANRAALAGLLRVADEYGAAVQWGGGVRSPEAAAHWLGQGVQRVVLGSLAVRQPQAVADLVQQWGSHRIAVSLDARRGRVHIQGWRAATEVRATALAADLAGRGARVFIVTDIARDGTGRGPNLALARSVAAVVGPQAQVIAAGGVWVLAHVLNTARAGLQGVVVGRALYEGTLDLRAALQALTDEGRR